MAASARKIKVGSVLLGICRPSLKHDASKFMIKYLMYDSFLKKYFSHFYEIFAHDPNKICKSGDIALLKELPQEMSPIIKHKVVEIVYPFGDITDPITGKKVVSGMFRDDKDFINSIYGEMNSSFNYYEAPPRGWQEDKRDFTHRETYIRYHEFDEDDENKNQPYSVYK